MAASLKKREKLDTKTNLGKHHVKVKAEYKEYQRWPAMHQQLRKGYGGDSLSSSKGPNTAGTMILDFWLSESGVNTFLVHQPPSLPWQPYQANITALKNHQGSPIHPIVCAVNVIC